MPDPGAEFDALADEFYGVWFRYHPDRALRAGVLEFGCLLPAQDDDDLAALGGWLETLILGLDEVDFAALDPGRQLDFSLMAGMARLERLELLEFDWRRSDPLAFLPVDEIHRLTLGPSHGLGDPLARLLGAVPEHLRQAQGQLRGVADHLAPSLVRAAVLEADGGRCYLRELVRGAWFRQQCQGLAELETLAEEACDALADYRAFLMDDMAPRASGDLGCGTGRLALRLEQAHFLELPPDPDGCRDALNRALVGVEAALAQTSDRAAEVRTADPPYHVESVAGQQQWHHRGLAPREICDAVRDEIEGSGMVTLPDAALHVVPRIACPRFPGGRADYLPGADGTGTLYLPAVIGDDMADPSAWLRGHCLTQGWGGSHLFAFSPNPRAWGIPRRLANGTTLQVGWDLYLERCLAERSDPATGRLRGSLARRRRQLVMGLLDLDIHHALVQEPEALARLKDIGLHGAAADAALVGLALSPGDALAGALGWLLLEAARDRLESIEGAAFSERRFHDRLVSQGAVPLPLALRYGFDESLWYRVSERVLGNA